MGNTGRHLPASEDGVAVDKLYIYDKTSELDVRQAAGRFHKGEVYTIGAASVDEVLQALDGLVAAGATFSRVLFQTHGTPGRIWFDSDSVGEYGLKEKFAPRNYHALFPGYTRIYFDGCNVAEDDSGTEFFRTAGKIFLKTGGGEVFGYTSVGHGVWGWVPIIGGHTLHLSGSLKKLYFRTGGVEYDPFRPIPVDPPNARWNVGNKV